MNLCDTRTGSAFLEPDHSVPRNTYRSSSEGTFLIHTPLNQHRSSTDPGLGYRRAETEALGGLGQVQRLIGEYHQAQEYHNQALALARRLGYRRAEADALAGLGEVKQLMGEYRQARDRYTQALTLSRDLNYRFGEAEALQGLGRIERLVGEYALVFRVGNF